MAATQTHRRLFVLTACVSGAAATLSLVVHAQPVPATQPTTQQSAYDRLLGNVEADRVDKPIQPVGPGTMTDQTSGANAVAPGSPQLLTRREGTFLSLKNGRMTRANDAAGGWEFTIDADGEALQDPPLKILPNLNLMAMEEQRETLNHDLRFRVSGTVTEYRGRNYLLIEKVVVVRDPP